jgi:hypothetical protein
MDLEWPSQICSTIGCMMDGMDGFDEELGKLLGDECSDGNSVIMELEQDIEIEFVG